MAISNGMIVAKKNTMPAKYAKYTKHSKISLMDFELLEFSEISESVPLNHHIDSAGIMPVPSEHVEELFPVLAIHIDKGMPSDDMRTLVFPHYGFLQLIF